MKSSKSTSQFIKLHMQQNNTHETSIDCVRSISNNIVFNKMAARLNPYFNKTPNDEIFTDYLPKDLYLMN